MNDIQANEGAMKIICLFIRILSSYVAFDGNSKDRLQQKESIKKIGVILKR